MTALYTTHAALYDAAFNWDVGHEVAPIGRHSGLASGRVLEPMCGSGRLLRGFAQAGYATVGIDLSRELLRIAVDRFAALGLSGEWLEADVTDFRLDAPCDLAVCPINSLAHLPDEAAMAAHLAAMGRSLSGGASYWVQLDLKQPTHSGEAEDWEFEFEGETLVVEWACSESRDGAETHLTRFVFPDGRVLEETYAMKVWTFEAWRRLIETSPFRLTAAFQGTSFESLPVDATLDGRHVFWQRLVKQG